MTAERGLPKSALALLARLADATCETSIRAGEQADARSLLAADLAAQEASGALTITDAGRAHLRRQNADPDAPVDPFRAQHLSLARRALATPNGRGESLIDEAESPLAWLSRRKGRDGRPLIEPVQLMAGERLRADFTRANMTPRVTSRWSATAAQGRHQGGAGLTMADAVIAARQRVRHALDAVGPEFSGLLLDICCFLKGLEEIERDRLWPPRSAKVVIQLSLDRLARHYGLARETQGRPRVPVRTWLADDAEFRVE
jgi:hypothetical protein